MPVIHGYEVGDESLRTRLYSLWNLLNNGNSYTVFFVISPRNGRLQPCDVALMKIVLDNIEQGPTVGLIFTQIHPRRQANIQNPDYTTSIHNYLQGVDCKTVEQLDSANNSLVLCTHRDDLDRFDDWEVKMIRRYVLGFNPSRMVVNDKLANMPPNYFELLRKSF